MPRSLLAALVAALAAIMPAAAWAQSFAQGAPTLTFDKPCYSPGDRMTFTGAGFLPGAAVELMFTTPGHSGSYEAQADAAGGIEDHVMTPDPDDFLADDRYSGTLSVTANGTTRADITLSRWEVQIEQKSGAPARAAKPMRVTAVGFTHAIGEPLYLHYTRAGRRLKTIPLGRLHGDCGDRTRVLRRGLPRSLKAGRYKLVFSTSAVNSGRTPSYWLKARLR